MANTLEIRTKLRHDGRALLRSIHSQRASHLATRPHEYYQKKLPVLEAFCEVMSIPDIDQRKKGLQRLEKHPDKWISSNAWAELRKMNQPKPLRKKRTPPDQGGAINRLN